MHAQKGLSGHAKRFPSRAQQNTPRNGNGYPAGGPTASFRSAGDNNNSSFVDTDLVQSSVDRLSETITNRIMSFHNFIEQCRLNEEDMPPYVRVLETVSAKELATAFCLPEVCSFTHLVNRKSHCRGEFCIFWRLVHKILARNLLGLC